MNEFAGAHVHDEHDEQTAEDYWEGQYSAEARRWSGEVNTSLASVVTPLPPGDALELGCGEGGDALWLAERGWRVTAVDISATAVARAADLAKERGVDDRITWIAHDLSSWTTEREFDLVTATFFHSSVELSRTDILRRAADRVRVGGHLVVISHVFETDADVPPWARRHRDEGHGDEGHGDEGHGDEGHGGHDDLLTPDEEIAELALDPGGWQVVTSEVRARDAVGPDGEERATVKDGIVVMKRTV